MFALTNRPMETTPSRFIELVYFDFGAGHKSAAKALKDQLSLTHPDWETRLVNLQDILKPIDLMEKFTGIRSHEVYNKLLESGMTYGSNTILRGLQKVIALNALRIEKLLQDHWSLKKIDLVVSLIPNFNGPMFRALEQAQPQTSYITLMTDLVDCPPNFWQEKQNQFLITGHDKATHQAHLIGYEPRRVFQVSGMILRPSFYEPQTTDRHLERVKIGLAPHKPTAIVMFGGYASKAATRIIKTLQHKTPEVQTIVMCGHNEELQRELGRYKACHAVGFTADVPYYMHLSDFFIGKPGPGSVSEALHMGLPVIVERNARTMPQERPNTRWIEDKELGLVIRNFGQVGWATRHLLSNNNLKRYQTNARSLNNRAIHEIPSILECIMNADTDIKVTTLAKL